MVPMRVNSNLTHIVGKHHGNLIHLIGQSFIQHPQEEHITLCELIQVREESG